MWYRITFSYDNGTKPYYHDVHRLKAPTYKQATEIILSEWKVKPEKVCVTGVRRLSAKEARALRKLR